MQTGTLLGDDHGKSVANETTGIKCNDMAELSSMFVFRGEEKAVAEYPLT